MSKKLYVGNIAPSTTEQALKEFFSPCGFVVSAKITLDHKGRSKGFGFVEMDALDAAAKAVAELNGAELDGQALTVNIAKPPATRDQRRVLANRRNRGRQ